MVQEVSFKQYSLVSFGKNENSPEVIIEDVQDTQDIFENQDSLKLEMR